jgi:galactokinase
MTGATRTVRAPGRVNVIGGQVDFHEGIVVSAALHLDTRLTYRPRPDGRVVVTSAGFDGTVNVAADGRDEPGTVDPLWGRNVGGLVRTLDARGRGAVGLDAATTSTLPAGAGLSSSAAFLVALGLALGDVAGWSTDPRDLSRACMEAEHIGSGFRCGIMDPVTSLLGVAGHVLVIDCRDLSVAAVPLPEGVRLAVVHSGVPRRLEATPYNERRAESFAAARRLGLEVLRDAAPEQVAADPRGRHVVAEIGRVRAFADALRAGRVDDLGPLLLASHASSRDDMGVSIPELDLLVDTLVECGAAGARLTGGGFGGCVVALVPADRATAVVEKAARRYEVRSGRTPLTAFVVRPSAGAGAVDG